MTVQATLHEPPCVVRLPRDDASALFEVLVDLLAGSALTLPAAGAVLAVAVQLDRQLARAAS